MRSILRKISGGCHPRESGDPGTIIDYEQSPDSPVAKTAGRRFRGNDKRCFFFAKPAACSLGTIFLIFTVCN
jgi:hypothetical protein